MSSRFSTCPRYSKHRAVEEIEIADRVVGDVRGAGLFCGAELVADRVTKEPADEKKVAAVVADCMAQGVIIGMTNRSLNGLNNTLCLSPALIATPDNIDQMTDAIDRALVKVFN